MKRLAALSLSLLLTSQQPLSARDGPLAGRRARLRALRALAADVSAIFDPANFKFVGNIDARFGEWVCRKLTNVWQCKI